MQQIREDFDRIALLSAHDKSAHNSHANFLLQHVPEGCDHALDIGCGLGEFTRLLASRARHVTAIDLSPEMIRFARERSNTSPNIEFINDDFLRLSLPPEAYDCVVTLATLHHLPLEETLGKIKDLVRPGGVLIIHDVRASRGLFDMALNFVRFPLSMALRFRQTGRLRARREVRRAWAEHGRREKYLTAAEARALRDAHFPGASLSIHFLWRYTLVWNKPLIEKSEEKERGQAPLPDL